MPTSPTTSALFLHRFSASALLAPRLGSSMVPSMRRHAPAVRRKPLDQCGRVLTYWHGNRSLPPQISCLPAPTDPAVPPRPPRACDVFDIYTIIFLALAVFIFLRLRSVLGQRTGRERPPYDPYSSAPGTIRPAPGDKVVALPGRAPDTAKPSEPSEPAADRWKGIA